MKIWKTLSKRGLALFLVLTMCMSLLQVTAFAEDLEAGGESGTVTYVCGKEAHTHGDECYTVTPETNRLTCVQEEAEGHTHGDGCYTVSETTELTCMDASEGHTHSDACYTVSEVKELTCGQEESAGHTHSDDCYTVIPETKELTCTKEEHTHTDDCLKKAEPPVEPVCTCETKCTEESVNGECPVCGAENADLSACKGEEAVTEVPDAVQAFLDAVEAFLDAFAALTEESTEEEYDAVMTLKEACDEAYDALAPEDLELEAVAEATKKLAAAMEPADTLEETDGAAKIGDVPYATLQEAIEAVGNDQTITLQKDITENVVSTSKSYTLDMGYHTLSSAKESTNVYTINGGTVIVQNGTITGGQTKSNYSYPGNGVLVYGNADVTMENVRVTGNECSQTKNVPLADKTVTVYGGGIGVCGSSLTLNNCEVSDNKGSKGGGIYALESSVMIAGGSKIAGNTASNFGTGIHVEKSDLAIDGASISGSSTSSYGVIYSSYPKTVSVKNADITIEGGNAIYAGSSPNIENPSVTLENVNVHGGETAFKANNLGTGKQLPFTAKNCTFQGMTPASQTSGIVYLGTPGEALLEGCTFTGNTTSKAKTAPVYITAKVTSGVQIEGCTFSGNTGFAAGAVYSLAPADITVAITGGSITGNTATSAGAIYKAGAGAMTIDGVTITGNSATGSATVSGGILTGGTGTVTVQNTVIKENTANCTATVTSYKPAGGVAATGGTFTMSSGALYGNTASKNGAACEGDVFFSSSTVTATILPASRMRDGDVSFASYYWGNGTTEVTGELTCNYLRTGNWAVMEKEAPKDVAQIGDTTYTSLANALAAAAGQDNVTIKLIAEDKTVPSGGMYAIGASCSVTEAVPIDCKHLTIDMNGCTISPTGAAANGGWNDAKYGVFQVNGGYTLTLTGEGVVGNRIMVKLNGTLNLSGNVVVESNIGAAYRADNAANYCGGVRSWGTVNVYSDVDSLRAQLYYDGTLNIASDATVKTLDVQMRCNESGKTASASIQGNAGDAVVCQYLGSSENGTNTVKIGGAVEKLLLTQNIAVFASTKVNTAEVTGKVENFTLKQTSKNNTVFLNGPVTNLSVNNYPSGTYIPTVEVGAGFKADSLTVYPGALVNIGSSSVQASYADPDIAVDDVVLITGKDGHHITSEQVGKTEWDTGSTALSDAFKANKHLTKVMVDDQGQIVLRKLKDDSSHIYLDGTAQADGSGTYLSPFNSFASAATAAGENGTIYVLGEVTVDTALNGQGMTLKRYETYKGALLKASGTASLTNIILDGGSEESLTATEPLVQVTGGTLTIGEGVVLQNNVNTYKATGHEGRTGGGALWIGSGAEAVMTGGVIKNNTAVMGGGVQVGVGGKFQLSGGTISGNFAGLGTGVTYTINGTKYGSAGGGVFISAGAEMTMTGGVIEENKSFAGGGIGLSGEIEPNQLVKFTMSGGTVQNNTAIGTGGGIYLNHNCEATILKACIVGNQAKVSAEGLHYTGYVGGGGIYVNGGKEADGATTPSGKLYLGNQTDSKILITENKATKGGGIAVCPTGTRELDFRSGTLVFGNINFTGHKDDLAIAPYQGGGITSRYIPMRAPDGSLYNWTDMDTQNPVNGSYFTSGRLSIHVYADVEFTVNESDYDIVISGNSSNAWGGGIGNNGDVRIGSPETTEIKVDGAKLWVDEKGQTITGKDLEQIKANVPTITFRLWSRHVSGEQEVALRIRSRMLSRSAGAEEAWALIDERKGSAENDWSVTFDRLLERDAKGELEYMIEEVEDSSYGKYVIKQNNVIVKPGEPAEIVNKVDYALKLAKVVDDPYGVAKEGAEYKFVITLKDASGNPVNGTFDGIEFNSGSADVTLRDGESATITGLGSGWTYTVTEKTPDGFKTPHFTTKRPYMRELGSGSVPDLETTYVTGETVKGGLVLGRIEITCSNTTLQPRNSLTISKTVAGNAGDKDTAWAFSLKLTDKDGNPLKAPIGQPEYAFDYSLASEETGTVTVNPDGAAVFTKTGGATGSATFTLKHGESLTIKDLPSGTHYAVTEEEANKDSYTTTAAINGTAAALADKTVSGTIGKDKDAGSLVAFTNTRVQYTVVHEYYTNNAKDGETRGDAVIGKIGDIVNADDIEKILTYNGGSYTFTSASPESITLDVDERNNVITLRYDRTVATAGYYTVIHQYYTNGAMDGSTTFTVRESVGTRINASDITPVPTYGGDTYTFTSVTGGGFAIVADVNSGTITLRYDRTVATEGSYRVVHEYYTNGTLTGSSSTAVTAAIGSVINVAGIVREPVYVGNTYGYTSTTPASATVAADGSTVITLRYDRTVTGPVTPVNPVTPVTPNVPDTPTPTPIPDTPTPVGPTPGTDIADPDVPLGLVGLNTVDHIAYIIGYEDGLVHPESNITRAEVATIFFRLMTDEFRTANWATQSAFPDVASANWFNNAVSTNGKAGIVKGYMDGEFKPNQNITRAEFAAIAARFLSDEDVGPGGRFSDISGHWAEEEINRAVAAGWIRGYEDGTFRPDQDITRAEAVTLINRMLDRMPDKDHLLENMITWPDNTEDKWYYEDMQEATNSHDYDRAEDGIMEVWTEKLEERKWKEFEYEWSTAASAPGREVADNLHGSSEPEGEGVAEAAPEATGDGEE